MQLLSLANLGSTLGGWLLMYKEQCARGAFLQTFCVVFLNVCHHNN